MKNADFSIQSLRAHLYKDDVIHIKGAYLNDAEKVNKIKFLLNDIELKFREEKIFEKEVKETGETEKDAVSAVFRYWINIPKIDDADEFKVVFSGKGKNDHVFHIVTGREIRKMIAHRNCDIWEKTVKNNEFDVSGWVIYSEDLEIKVYSEIGEADVTTIVTDDEGLSAEYPEFNNADKTKRFRIRFNKDNKGKIVVKIITDGRENIFKSNTIWDFDTEKSMIKRIRKSLSKRGVKGTGFAILKKARDPRNVSRFVYRKSGMKRIKEAGIRKKIHAEETMELQKKFGYLYHRFPVASRKLLYLNALSAIQAEKKMRFSGDIKFSIVVPLYNTRISFLKEMIESVQIQTYDNWELCLADGSDDKHSYVKKICKSYAKRDKRIVYKKLEENLGISGNTNECIKLVTGDFVALLDHDDFLHPRALNKCYSVIKEKGADFVYTDEAVFQSELYNLTSFHYKPDYAPDNLRGNNYICHFSVFSKELLDKSGWYDTKYDGSQDHELILRLTNNAKHVEHIPEVLYFWRSHPGSVAEDIASKTYAINAGKMAVQDNLIKIGQPAVVESSAIFPMIYRIRYELKEKPMISIIIPNRNHYGDLRRCIDSVINKSTYDNYEIIVVENGSNELDIFEYYEKLRKNEKIRVITWNDEFNYAAINNFAAEYANGSYLLFLNNDIEVITPEWMEELLMYGQRRDVAAVGAKLYYSDNTIQHAGIILGLGEHGTAGHCFYKCDKRSQGYMGRLHYSQNLSAVTAACMLMKKSIFEEIGGFDERYAVAYNDVDLCLKAMESGYLNIFNPYAELYHYESATRGMEDTSEKYARFLDEAGLFKAKWAEVLEKGDKYFNKNFELTDANFKYRENNLFRESRKM